MQNVGDSMKVGTAGDRACVNSWVTLAGACGRFEIQVGKTSIGADISVFSQFEAEKEYLYAPLTHLQLLGQPRLEDHNGKQLSVLSMQLTGKGRRGLVCKKRAHTHIFAVAQMYCTGTNKLPCHSLRHSGCFSLCSVSVTPGFV